MSRSSTAASHVAATTTRHRSGLVGHRRPLAGGAPPTLPGEDNTNNTIYAINKIIYNVRVVIYELRQSYSYLQQLSFISESLVCSNLSWFLFLVSLAAIARIAMNYIIINIRVQKFDILYLQKTRRFDMSSEVLFTVQRPPLIGVSRVRILQVPPSSAAGRQILCYYVVRVQNARVISQEACVKPNYPSHTDLSNWIGGVALFL